MKTTQIVIIDTDNNLSDNPFNPSNTFKQVLLRVALGKIDVLHQDGTRDSVYKVFSSKYPSVYIGLIEGDFEPSIFITQRSQLSTIAMKIEGLVNAVELCGIVDTISEDATSLLLSLPLPDDELLTYSAQATRRLQLKGISADFEPDDLY